MKREGLYPKTGTYREDRNTIEEILPEIVDKDFEERASEFIRGIEYASPSEREDVLLFARHAYKRISSSSIAAHKRFWESRPQYSYSHNAKEVIEDNGLLWHDLSHAMFRYKKTNGKKLAPRFLEIDGYDAQYTDPEAFAEECYVQLWEHFENHVQAQKDTHASPSPQQQPLEFYLRGFENKYIAQDQIKLLKAVGGSETGMKEMRERLDDFQMNRDPDYLRLAVRLYEKAVSENPNERLYIEEFEAMVAPLLHRLRKEAGARKA